ncbi:rod shape-determining protein MreD [Candidatus Kryptobacter tengchongensis]|uniref:Rod shape-determining protein MreD n=1 Tax=Kryptobacter tengchongensis TaxID=1643429 RepID=A0A916LJJ3_KRYT1|nr:rod shape-determining protein MreD [Candidatus Kryptobacter tengchongensis]CUS98194.1 rod shape-determining protein MreD [Candidatus Kryptobacter tengchongensis]CUU03864.1 rod shape-determining protein MreD [Candidatus Kryptobacter tengchongensis]CUU04715.1 rod shape-determining protein MreD [Candidatus Kryptobacter tengchongensis]
MVYIRYFIVGIVILIVQMVIAPLIAIEGVTPDLMTIFIVYVALKNGQIPGTVAGFISGLLIDFLIDFVPGLSTLSKTVAGFVAGYFYGDAKVEINTETLRFSAITVFISALDNFVYFLVDILGNSFNNVAVFKLIIGKTVYTSILSLIPVFTTSKRTKLI